jgi:predicted RNase H-like HicB family nuclease
MGQLKKVLSKVLSGTSDANISFTSLCYLITKLGFVERVKGDHFIYTKEGVEEILNIQPKASKNNYEMIIYWSKEDNCFIAEVPELSGCMADGGTYQEAVSNAEVVIQEWIETSNLLGRKIPEPRGKLMYA